jgi:hypothetical protein
MNETDETQLKALMQGTQFSGTFTKNDLNYIPNGNTIYNLNGTSHWVAMCRDGDNFFYFDSYGVVPPQHLEDLIMEGSKDGLYMYNTKEIQAINSSSCGFYCVAFLKWMDKAKQKYKAFKDFQNLFTDQYQNNEIVLHELLKMNP